MVRKDIGQFAKLNGIIVMDRLPKTRSGKILRGTIKSIVNKMEYKMPSTIEDVATLEEISEAFEHWKSTEKK
jgi:propionyl-CoA synthetase